MCAWEGVCFCPCQMVKGCMVMGVVHNFQIDSQSCTSFSGKVDHEPEDS